MDLAELKLTQGEINRHPWELARLEVVKDLIHRIKSRYQKEKGQVYNIMDVGCGDSYVAAQLAKVFEQDRFFGYDKYMTDEEYQVLDRLYGHVTNLRIGASYKELSHDVPQISMVLLLDVIEHIDDIVGFLQGLRGRSNVTHQTCLLITVPAYQSLFTDHDVFLKHFRRYDKAIMQGQMQESGYEILEQGHFFSSLVLPRWLKKKMTKPLPLAEIEKRHSGLAKWKGGALTTQLIKGVLYQDFKFNQMMRSIGLELPGLSLYCICRPIS